jgi:IclR family acetate operon transcriptional repressor
VATIRHEPRHLSGGPPTALSARVDVEIGRVANHRQRLPTWDVADYGTGRILANVPPAVQSVGRAIRILELVAEHPGQLGVTDLGRRLGVHKATAFRLVTTLVQAGLLEKAPGADRYRLGFGLVRLATAALADLDLVRQARPILERLAEETQETVNLAVLDGLEVVNVDQVAGRHSVLNVNWVGRRTPVHCTSNGKVLVAHLPEDRWERILAGPLERRTPRTITDPEMLRVQLREARARGYAYTVEELEVGLNAVAAPVHAPGGVVAAISVAGPAYRVTPERIPELAAAVTRAGAEASRRMGHIERRTSVAAD